ncbi:uncharacterized protein LOC127738469 [Mytilus californianus]|uniref:Foot protein 10 n=1 Tax=Mytilus californianus TaxID=6549 RepID=A0A223HCJ8_MYTCA|nr:uncharacterized protein LOC127738469 [Mytilus californianus]AST36128.1 foot protein 10 [Mytilus californianus]
MSRLICMLFLVVAAAAYDYNSNSKTVIVKHSALGDEYGIGIPSVVSYSDFSNKYHGFKISNGRFSFGGIAYKLKCGQQRFYNVWSNCWSIYHSRSVCFDRLKKQSLFVDYPGGNIIDDGYKAVVVKNAVYGDDDDIGYGSAVSYLDYFNKFHGFKISDNRFSYGGKAYTLKCGLQRFYNVWGGCWSNYHSRSVCFDRLMNQNLFAVYPGDYDYDGAVYGDDYDIGVGSVVSYLDYCNKFHGFKISDNRFSYGGTAYTLRCGLQRFYNLWGNCWNSYHSRKVCFDRLRTQNLFVAYPGGYDYNDGSVTAVVKNAVSNDLY